MATELRRNLFKEIVEDIFNRWSALKLAVEHGMAKNGLQTAIDFVDYVTDSCIMTNSKVSEEDLIDLLEDILDQEFDTICEDESTKDISRILLRYLELVNSGQLELIKTELSQMPPCPKWLVKGNKISVVRDDSSSSDDDDEMEMESENSVRISHNEAAPSTSGSTMQVEEEDVDPGWTVVKKGKKRN